MDTKIRTQLENVLEHGSDFYQATARALLTGELTWPDSEIASFLDGFMNDPYLTRNSKS
jgi:hypothetical protein